MNVHATCYQVMSNIIKVASYELMTSRKSCNAVFPNLGPPDVLGLQLPEILASRSGGEGFWEL